MLSMIYFWADEWQHGIHMLNLYQLGTFFSFGFFKPRQARPRLFSPFWVCTTSKEKQIASSPRLTEAAFANFWENVQVPSKCIYTLWEDPVSVAGYCCHDIAVSISLSQHTLVLLTVLKFDVASQYWEDDFCQVCASSLSEPVPWISLFFGIL